MKVLNANILVLMNDSYVTFKLVTLTITIVTHMYYRPALIITTSDWLHVEVIKYSIHQVHDYMFM